MELLGELWGTMKFLFEWRLVVVLAGSLFILVVFIRSWFGSAVAWSVLTAGLAAITFKIGQKIQKDYSAKQSSDIEEKREAAYVEIDGRDTGRDDVLDRLRDDKF